jgi:hypothetical protein
MSGSSGDQAIKRRRLCSADRVSARDQLDALAQLHGLLQASAIDYWVFGGWAVDLHARRVTRQHDDLDLVAWLSDREQIDALLSSDGWEHTPVTGEDRYSVFERNGVRLELAWLAADEHGTVYTPLRDGGRGAWPAGAFGDDLGEIEGVRARVIGLVALDQDKSEVHGDDRSAAKDRTDREVLGRLLRDR